MGIIRQRLRLSNIAMPQIEEIDALALVDSGALELCIPQSMADRLKLTCSLLPCLHTRLTLRPAYSAA